MPLKVDQLHPPNTSSLMRVICLFLLLGSAFALRPAVHTKRRGDWIDDIDPDDAEDYFSIDEVRSLPGFDEDDFGSTHYSGYIRVSPPGAPVRRLFFYYAESQNEPEEDPVVLWLNGGPGCSSFDGFFYEHGPFNFYVEEDGRGDVEVVPRRNPYSWNTAASVLYLDSPAGVGFSYAVDRLDIERNDTQTAHDTTNFLRLWFKFFPERTANQFFLSGESYAGVYIPTLAQSIVDYNKRALRGSTIPLEGYLIGNPLTDWLYDGNTLPEFARGHGLITQKLYDDVRAACGPIYYNATPGSACDKQVDLLDIQLASLNLYDILEPCAHGPVLKGDAGKRAPRAPRVGASSKDVQASRGRFEGFTVGRAWPLKAVLLPNTVVPTWAQVEQIRGPHGNTLVPCTDSSLADNYFNRDDVRDAINAERVDDIGDWNLCTGKIIYTHDLGSMIPYHKNLVAQGLRALIYSGDQDMCIVHTGTDLWTRTLGLKVVEDQRPWFTGEDPQVAGYVRKYAGLTFATIKGAGHMVPQVRPAEALDMFVRFISNNNL